MSLGFDLVMKKIGNIGKANFVDQSEIVVDQSTTINWSLSKANRKSRNSFLI